ncbi:hypothetical protein BH20CHL7_BH20CHL7_08850 [soil metagenome]
MPPPSLAACPVRDGPAIRYESIAVSAESTVVAEFVPDPDSRFEPDGAHGEQKERVLAKLGAYLERFFGLGSRGA